MNCLHLPRTSPLVSLNQCSHCHPFHYLSLSFSWKRAKSLCFLCMPAMDLQGNQCRRPQCLTPYVVSALIKTITAVHSFHSYGVDRWQGLRLFPSGCWFFFCHPSSLQGESVSTVSMQMKFVMCVCVFEKERESERVCVGVRACVYKHLL